MDIPDRVPAELNTESTEIIHLPLCCAEQFDRIAPMQELVWSIVDRFYSGDMVHPEPGVEVHYTVDYRSVQLYLSALRTPHLIRSFHKGGVEVRQYLRSSLSRHTTPQCNYIEGHFVVNGPISLFDPQPMLQTALTRVLATEEQVRFIWRRRGGEDKVRNEQLLLNPECPADVRAEILKVT